MRIIKKPYEISVWEDKIQYVGTDGIVYDNISNMPVPVDYQYYTEKRLATIGSDKMTSQTRVINPVLTRNINGTETLKFDIYYQFIDNITGEETHNPLVDLLVNERKIKLYYDDYDPNHPDKWYDFIIKKDEEKARDNKYSFTCNSLAAHELGKTGFRIELDTELENNMGTVQELGKKVLENSDWQLSTEGQDIIKQTVNEPLYQIYLNQQIPAKYTQDGETTVSISAGEKIYVYYTSYANKEKDYFQFIYIADESQIELQSDRMTLICDDENVYDLFLTDVEWINNKPAFQDGVQVVANYRGDRYVRKQKTAYDSTLKKTVNIYTDNSEPARIVYGYQTTEYYGVDAVQNYIHNSVNFGGTSYWYGFGDGSSIERIIYPPASDGLADRTSYLSVKIGPPIYVDQQIDYINSPRLMNNGIIYNYSKIKSFDKNSTYLLRMKVKKMKDGILGDYITYNNFPFTCQIRKYTKVDQNTGERCFNFLGSNAITDPSNPNFILIEAKCEKSASIEELKNNIGIFFFRSNNYGTLGENDSYYIEEVQLTEGIWQPDTETAAAHWLQIDEVPVVKSAVIDHYYYPSENIDKTSADDYVYISEEETGTDVFTPVYGDTEHQFEKVRSITVKESNRFNLLQQLCETFECWIKFNITHEANGQISIEDYDYYEVISVTEEQYTVNTYYIYDHLNKEYILSSNEYDDNKIYYDKKERKRQDKKVVFYGEILEDNPIGFKYGINLKDVVRTLDSDQIATKIIVKNNSNEYANNGFCSIARAKDNPTKENFLYNFDYYVKQGILDWSTLYNDLYLKDVAGSIGLYPTLAELNNERNEIISIYTELANDITKAKSEVETYTVTYNSAAEDLTKLTDPVSGKLIRYTGYIYEDFGDQVARAYVPNNTNHIIDGYENQIYYAPNSFSNIIVTAKNYSGSNVNGISYYEQIIFPAEETGAQVKVNHSGEVNGDKFNGWDALKYYIKNGNQYRRCEYDQTIDDQKYYVRLGKNDKTPFYIKGSSNTFTQAEIYVAPNDGTTYYWHYNDNESGLNKDNCKYLQTPSNTSKLQITKNGDVSKVYVYGAYRRIGEASPDDTVNDTSTINYIEQITTLQKDKDEAETLLEERTAYLENKQVEYDKYTARLNDIAKATEEIERQFLIKYARYVQEGSWTDDNYMDDDLYYLDAVQVLYQSAYPKVSYTISVLDLSALEDYKPYKFQIAHRTFIEDTEFFGWEDKARRIPARERIVVTELTTNLDQPDKNSIKVQNYRNHFEDLFQRITAATQNLEYHSGDYKRAADAVKSNGEIDNTIMERTMATAQFVIQNANNQSVTIDETGLQATKTDDPAQQVKLTSGGLLVSTDGGKTWGVAITGYGISTEYLRAGIIDADKINIYSGAYPTFRWDGYGIRALAYTADENRNVTSYNPSNYVTFDRFGLYGINGITNFIPNSVTDVERKANFALTWNGLFIRSNYRSGYVSISPNDDITLYSYSSQYFGGARTNNLNNDNFDELYYLINRNALYYLDNNIYIKCTTESYQELENKNLFVLGYQRINNPPEHPGENYYYLYNGEFIECIGDEPTVLINNMVYQKINSGSGITPLRRAKFGMLGVDLNNNELYGLALYNQIGKPTVITQSDGTLWLQDSMKIGTEGQTNTIYLGVGEMDTTPGTNRYKVFNVNDQNNNEKFVVFSDGTLKASGAIIEGTGTFIGDIYANGGKIGNMTIESLSDTIGVRISPNTAEFKYGESIATPNSITFTVVQSFDGTVTYQWYLYADASQIDQHPIPNATSNSYTYNFDYSDFSSGITYLKVKVFAGNDSYEDRVILSYVTDGQNGEDANQYVIHTNVEEILKFVKVNTSSENLKKYEFSLETLQMNVYDIKNQLNISNTNVTLDVEIEGFKFADIIKPAKYTNYIEVKENDNINFFFNIGTLYDNLLDETLYQDLKVPEQGETDWRDNFISSLQNFFTNLGVSDIIVYGNTQLDNKIFNIEKYVSLKNGLSDEMLNFSINAGSINAAIQNSKLNFNADGLTITNGGFRIKNNSGKDIFNIDPNTNQLYMEGTGTFTGDIYANNGRFNGEINATTGTIGGFSIGEYSIESDNLVLTSSHGNIESSIQVENIKIGNGAEIIGSISIGNLKLLKPNNDDDNVLVLTNNDINYFSLKNNGDIEGNGWFIKKENNETVARFDNGIFKGTIEATNGYFEGEITASVINASTINTVNFITEKIRSMGGAFIFKPSFEINSFEINDVYIYVTFNNDKDYNTFRVNDIVGFTTDEDGKGIIIGQVRAITPPSGENWKNYTIKVQTYSQLSNDLTTITWFGNTDEDVIIGINSDNQSAGSLLPQKSLSIQDFTFNNNILVPSIKLLLGDLSPISNIIGENPGYGLYADNVYLKGSLTTSGGNNNYAGINTQGPVDFNYAAWDPNGTHGSDYQNHKIIFWGGASNTTDNGIQNSKFIVTDKGSIFATSGEFKGSVISDSIISKSIIQAAIIEGTGNSPSLKIYNTDKDNGGIGFYQKGNPDILTLLINSEGLNYNNDKIINFNNNNIIFNGSEFIANQMKLSSTQLSNNGSKIEFDNETIEINYNTNAGIEISSGQVRNFGGKVVNEGSMILKDTTITPAKLEYIVKNNYYCLMVTKGSNQS